MAKKIGVVRLTANELSNSTCILIEGEYEEEVSIITAGAFASVAYELAYPAGPDRTTFLTSILEVVSIPNRGRVVTSYMEHGEVRPSVPY